MSLCDECSPSPSFLLLATYLIRHATLEDVVWKDGEGEHSSHRLMARSEHNVGRLGGGPSRAVEQWFVEGWFYIIAMSVAIGVLLGTMSLRHEICASQEVDRFG